MKIRTSSDLQDALDAELAWRVKEISGLSLSIKSGGSIAEPTLIRAGIALLYAHFEGFVKKASEHYVEFVSRRGLNYSSLKSNFIFLGLRKELNQISDAKKSKAGREILETILAMQSQPSHLSFDKNIRTHSNLSSSVFDDILDTIGINNAFYITYFHLIDKSLLDRRNSIAHGEYLDIGAHEWNDLSKDILLIMRSLKTDIENNAALNKYRA